MKNIQVIDGAANCTYDIFAATNEEFEAIFPNGTNIEFIEDVVERLGEDAAGQVLEPLWSRPVAKSEVQGIHGTLFYGLLHKKQYYPNKLDSD